MDAFKAMLTKIEIRKLWKILKKNQNLIATKKK